MSSGALSSAGPVNGMGTSRPGRSVSDNQLSSRSRCQIPGRDLGAAWPLRGAPCGGGPFICRFGNHLPPCVLVYPAQEASVTEEELRTDIQATLVENEYGQGDVVAVHALAAKYEGGDIAMARLEEIVLEELTKAGVTAMRA